METTLADALSPRGRRKADHRGNAVSVARGRVRSRPDLCVGSEGRSYGVSQTGPGRLSHMARRELHARRALAEEPSWGLSVIRLALSVEGQTEREFVNKVLAAHLRVGGVEATPVLLGRARGRAGGGSVSVERLASDMVRLSSSFDAVTSLVDCYGFRRKVDETPDALQVRVLEEIERCIGHEMNQSKMWNIRSQFANPEDINDHSQTAPSKRIVKVIPRYRKVVDGPPLAAKIGLTAIRAECPQFGVWLTRLESMGTTLQQRE